MSVDGFVEEDCGRHGDEVLANEEKQSFLFKYEVLEYFRIFLALSPLLITFIFFEKCEKCNSLFIGTTIFCYGNFMYAMTFLRRFESFSINDNELGSFFQISAKYIFDCSQILCTIFLSYGLIPWVVYMIWGFFCVIFFYFFLAEKCINVYFLVFMHCNLIVVPLAVKYDFLGIITCCSYLCILTLSEYNASVKNTLAIYKDHVLGIVLNVYFYMIFRNTQI